MKCSIVLPALVALVLGPAAATFADPITVASANAARIYIVDGGAPYGSINVWQSGPTIDFNLSGMLASTFPVDVYCQPCVAGQSFNPGYGVAGEIATVSGWRGDPQDPVERWSDLSLIGNFRLNAASMTLPADAPPLYNVALPLTFEASLYGATTASWAAVVMHVQAFKMPGEVAVQFRTWTDPAGQRLFAINSLDYTAQATPTPEPASMLMVGTVLAGFGASRLRKNRRRQSAMANPPISNESRN